MDSSIKMGTIDPDSLPLVGNMNPSSLRLPPFPPENSVQSSHHYFFRLPAQTDPLGKVISNSHPHRLHCHLDQTTQMKLATPKFLFDPSIGKFCNLRPVLINFTSRLAGHLLPMSPHFRGLFRAHQRAPLALWTTLPFRKTTLAIHQLGPIPVTRGTLALLLTLKSQISTRRTDVTIPLRIIRKSLRKKLWDYTPLLKRSHRLARMVRHRPDQINPLGFHRHHRPLIDKPGVPHHLLRYLPQIRLDPLDRRRQLRRVIARLTDPTPYNHIRLRIAGDLHIIAGRKPPIRLLHNAGLGIRRTHPRGLPLFRTGLRLQLLQFSQRRFQPLLFLAGSPLSGFGHTLIPLLRTGIPHLLYLLPRGLQMLLQGPFAPKTLIRR